MHDADVRTDGLTRRQLGVVALGGVVISTGSSVLAQAPNRAGYGLGAVGPVLPALASGDGLPRRTPEQEGVSSAAILAFLDDVAKADLELHSFMLARRGSVIAEGHWWPYAPDRIHITHSLTKSVTACAVAIALGEKRFALDDKVVSFFPEHEPADASANLRAMTVRHLLSMTTGHDKETSGSAWRPIKTSWIAEFMKIPVVHTPGSKFVYTSASSYMLSAIVTKTTGQPMAEYLRPRLFRPLGIEDFEWDLGPEAINPGGNGLSWKTADSLKLGMLHAQGGRWQGRQILPAAFVAAATRKQVPDGKYGYHWWMGEGSAYYALGLFTQLSIVFPEQETTLAVFGAIDGSSKLLPTIWKHFPAALGPRPIAQSAATVALKRRAADLRLLPPLAATTSPIAARGSRRRFVAAPNDQGVGGFLFDFAPDRVRFALRDERGEHWITAGLSQWLEQSTSMTGNRLHHEYQPPAMRVIAGARWEDARTLKMTWQFVETAFRDTVLCRFDGDTVTLDRSVNLNSRETKLPTLTGRLI